LCNCIALRLDHRLAGLGRRFGFAYTRYADDLTFSGDDPKQIRRLRKYATRIIEAEGFRVNTDKTAVARKGGCPRGTGVVGNDVLGLSRQERRLLRAVLHRLRREVAAGTADPREIAALRGKLAYLAMLNPEQAAVLQRQFDTLSEPQP